MLRIRRGPNQTDRDIVRIFNAGEEDASAGIDPNQRYFGDSSRMTGIKKPVVNLATSPNPQAIATANAAAIQAALDAAESDPDIHTIQLPNTEFLCDRLTLGFIRTGEFEIERVNHSGLTIEGGGKTFLINKYHPAGFGVFFGEPYVIGYYHRIIDYQPGEPDVTEVTIQSGDPIVGVSQ